MASSEWCTSNLKSDRPFASWRMISPILRVAEPVRQLGVFGDRLAAQPILLVVIKHSVVNGDNLLIAESACGVCVEEFPLELPRECTSSVVRLLRCQDSRKALLPSVEGGDEPRRFPRGPLHPINPLLIRENEIEVFFVDCVCRTRDLSKIMIRKRCSDDLEVRDPRSHVSKPARWSTLSST